MNGGVSGDSALLAEPEAFGAPSRALVNERPLMDPDNLRSRVRVNGGLPSVPRKHNVKETDIDWATRRTLKHVALHEACESLLSR